MLYSSHTSFASCGRIPVQVVSVGGIIKVLYTVLSSGICHTLGCVLLSEAVVLPLPYTTSTWSTCNTALVVCMYMGLNR